MEQYFWCFENWKLSQKPGSIGLGYNHSHLTDSTAAILGNHERGVQAGSQLKLQCRILKILQPHEKPPFDETMKWLHNGQKVSILYCLCFEWQHQKLSNCPKKMANFFSPYWTFTARNGHRNNVLETWRFFVYLLFPLHFLLLLRRQAVFPRIKKCSISVREDFFCKLWRDLTGKRLSLFFRLLQWLQQRMIAVVIELESRQNGTLRSD